MSVQLGWLGLHPLRLPHSRGPVAELSAAIDTPTIDKLTSGVKYLFQSLPVTPTG